ncbi:MAG TPA: GNAT family N-acetyltransferase [Clostridiales bacterium]|nr:GNAT family N-acetyltransferase [Clostridiales bacterium]
MDEQYYINCIVKGIERYFRIFAQSGIIYNHMGSIEWIKPIQGEVGPSIVYGVKLGADEDIDIILKGIKDGIIPSFWYVLPNATPNNIVDILKEKGFVGEIPTNPEEKEYGMALDLQTTNKWIDTNLSIEVKRVKDFSDFQCWIDIVNSALHGWKMIDAEHYFTWVSQNNIAFYIGYLNGVPISTAATITDQDNASLEFVSTLEEYRRQGAGTAVCVEALKQLKEQDVKTVILGSSPEATSMYKRLGFVPYFEKVLLALRIKGA